MGEEDKSSKVEEIKRNGQRKIVPGEDGERKM